MFLLLYILKFPFNRLTEIHKTKECIDYYISIDIINIKNND